MKLFRVSVWFLLSLLVGCLCKLFICAEHDDDKAKWNVSIRLDDRYMQLWYGTKGHTGTPAAYKLRYSLAELLKRYPRMIAPPSQKGEPYGWFHEINRRHLLGIRDFSSLQRLQFKLSDLGAQFTMLRTPDVVAENQDNPFLLKQGVYWLFGSYDDLDARPWFAAIELQKSGFYFLDFTGSDAVYRLASRDYDNCHINKDTDALHCVPNANGKVNLYTLYATLEKERSIFLPAGDYVLVNRAGSQLLHHYFSVHPAE